MSEQTREKLTYSRNDKIRIQQKPPDNFPTTEHSLKSPASSETFLTRLRHSYPSPTTGSTVYI